MIIVSKATKKFIKDKIWQIKISLVFISSVKVRFEAFFYFFSKKYYVPLSSKSVLLSISKSWSSSLARNALYSLLATVFSLTFLWSPLSIDKEFKKIS